MALLHCNFFAETLGMPGHFDLILPQPADADPSCPPLPESPPCLWLLHGLSDDHTIWQRRTSIERYATARGLAVIMPDVQRSFYADMAQGYRYWTYLTEELPAFLARNFRLSTRRVDTFAAGLSMGGYGAFKLGLTFPERFAAVASLSGALDIASRNAAETYARIPDWPLLFGDAPVAGSNNDLFALLGRHTRAGTPSPEFFQWCGTEDFLYKENLAFRNAALRLNLPLTYREGPGDHTWALWDRVIQDVIRWLPLRPPASTAS